MASGVFSEKLEAGWIHAKMFFEVLAGNAEAAKESLTNHIAQIKKMSNIVVGVEKYSDAEKVEHVPEKFKGKDVYSQIVEVDVAVSSLENLIYMVVFFGPSSVEVISPKELKIGFESAQAMANTVAEMMHKFAAAGAGGIIINTKR